MPKVTFLRAIGLLLGLWLSLPVVILIFFPPATCPTSIKNDYPSSERVVALLPTPSWGYYRTTDEMTGKTTQTAAVESTNTVNFSSPYQGEQRATLNLRKHPRYGNDVILQIERGQFLPGIDGVNVIARFDDRPSTFLAREAEDHSMNLLELLQVHGITTWKKDRQTFDRGLSGRGTGV